MFPSDLICQETVSILHAVIFGAEGACVSIDVASVLTALVPFVAGVVILQRIARRLFAKVTRAPAPNAEATEKTGPFDVKYDGGPVKSNRGWW